MTHALTAKNKSKTRVKNYFTLKKTEPLRPFYEKGTIQNYRTVLALSSN